MMRKMMEEMQKMCKHMSEGNMTPFMENMKMPNHEMMEEMCTMMGKRNFGSHKPYSEFMEKSMKK